MNPIFSVLQKMDIEHYSIQPKNCQSLGRGVKKQVAQKAMIIHLSPMCQDQIWSFQKGCIKTNWEKVETSFSPL